MSTKNSCKIVMYHYVRPIIESEYPKIKGLEVKRFNNQLNYFSKHFNFISACELLDSIYNNTKLDTNSLLLTFDDGFKDHYSHVFPILKKLDIKGLFFPPSLPIENNIVLDVHKIHFLLANCKNNQELFNKLTELISLHKDEYDLQSLGSYLSRIDKSGRFDDEYTIVVKSLLQWVLPKKARNDFLNILFQKHITKDETSFAKELYLSYEEIAEMVESEMYFGSHSHTHEWFENISDEELKNELENSSKFLTKINKNKDNWIISYPCGSYNETVIHDCKKLGYRAGLTSIVEDALLTKENAFELGRYDTNDFPQ